MLLGHKVLKVLLDQPVLRDQSVQLALRVSPVLQVQLVLPEQALQRYQIS